MYIYIEVKRCFLQAGDPDASSEEANNNMKMADSAGFFLSLITSLLGDMSKSSSGSNSWRRHDND